MVPGANGKQNRQSQSVFDSEIRVGKLSDKEIRRLFATVFASAVLLAAIYFFNLGERVAISDVQNFGINIGSFGVSVFIGWGIERRFRIASRRLETIQSGMIVCLLALGIYGVWVPVLEAATGPCALFIIGIDLGSQLTKIDRRNR